MSQVHCDPHEALNIHKDLNSVQSAAIHWGTFPLADEDVIEPALELARCRLESAVSSNSFFTMLPGETHILGSESRQDVSKIAPGLIKSYIDKYATSPHN